MTNGSQETRLKFKSRDGLPAPNKEELVHSEQLARLIRRTIQVEGGSISFARYMDMALYLPGLGYYSAGARKFGVGGDFVTAPEISPLFAACLGNQCRQVLAALGGGEILEFGPGSGILAHDLLLTLERLQCLPDRYHLLEVSADLRERQQAKLSSLAPHLWSRLHWHTVLPKQGIKGLVIANEVMDALPVHRFRIEDQYVLEKRVTWQDGNFMWLDDLAADGQLADRIEFIRKDLGSSLPYGYESEISLAIEPWIGSLSDVVSDGVVLLIDYGYPRKEYYHMQRTAGTLICHYRHRAHPDPFYLPGIQDITSFIDFTVVAEAGIETGFELAGFTTQGNFLLSCGLDRILADSDPADTRRHLEMTRQAKFLTLPGEMGERFKVMALKMNLDCDLLGFGFQDHRDRL